MRCKYCGGEWQPWNKFYNMECCKSCHDEGRDMKKKRKKNKKKEETRNPRVFRDGTCQDGEQYEEAGLTTGLEVERGR